MLLRASRQDVKQHAWALVSRVLLLLLLLQTLAAIPRQAWLGRRLCLLRHQLLAAAAAAAPPERPAPAPGLLRRLRRRVVRPSPVAVGGRS